MRVHHAAYYSTELFLLLWHIQFHYNTRTQNAKLTEIYLNQTRGSAQKSTKQRFFCECLIHFFLLPLFHGLCVCTLWLALLYILRACFLHGSSNGSVFVYTKLLKYCIRLKSIYVCIDMCVLELCVYSIPLPLLLFSFSCLFWARVPRIYTITFCTTLAHPIELSQATAAWGWGKRTRFPVKNKKNGLRNKVFTSFLRFITKYL